MPVPMENSAGKLPDKRWATSYREPTTQWTTETLTTWLQVVLGALHEHPMDGFAWTSHSLRKGAPIIAYGIGTPVLQIKFFGGWAGASHVVLDYIRVHRPNSTPEPGSLATICLDDPWRSTTHRHTPIGDIIWHK
jgi:hypothetical protein